MDIRRGTVFDTRNIVKIIRNSYRTVASRFDLNMDNCPKHPSNCSADWIKKDFEEGTKYFLLGTGETPQGCVGMFQKDSETCYLERLAVLPEGRGQGFGRALVEHIFEEVKLLGCEKISIGIISKQIELKNWYQRLGFIEYETRTYEYLPFQVTLMKYKIS